MSTSRDWRIRLRAWRELHNLEVREWFRDLTQFRPEASGRELLAYSCLIPSDASMRTATAASNLFRYGVQRVQDRPAVYGYPIEDYQREHRMLAQLQLHWKETRESYRARGKRWRTEMRVSIRLSSAITESLKQSDQEADRLAVQIEQNFLDHQFTKGKIVVSYVDRRNPHLMKINSSSVQEAKELLTKVLALNNETPDFAACLRYRQFDNGTGPSQGTTQVFGEEKEMPEFMPIVNVRWYKAELKMPGIQDRILAEDIF